MSVSAPMEACQWLPMGHTVASAPPTHGWGEMEPECDARQLVQGKQRNSEPGAGASA